MGAIPQGFFYALKEVNRCQRNRSDRVPIPAVQSLPTAGFVRCMRSKRTSATRSTTETLLYAVVMAELGSVLETAMCNSILCVSCAKRKVCLFLPKRSIIASRLRKAAHTHERISLLFANRVTPESMQSEVIVGTTTTGRGGQNLCGLHAVQRAWGLTHKIAVSNGVYKALSKEVYANG